MSSEQPNPLATGAAIDGVVSADQPLEAGPPRQFRGRVAASSVRWSALAVIGKQVFQLVAAIVLARLLGPNSYGVISAAMIYVTLTALLLDQGLTAALVQRKDLSPRAPGAAATANLVMGVGLGALTWLFADPLAGLLRTDALAGMLRVLGAGLVLKALAIVPRAMLSRRLTFRPIAVADVAGSIIGAAFGVAAALLGAGYHALLYQTLTADAVAAAVLLAAAHGPRPNLHLGELRTLLPFGLRIFATTSVAYLSRNTDNVLVARYLGATSLSYYAMAYRVLVIPVQMLGQTVNRVLFPALSRLADRRDEVARTLLVATELLAVVTVPAMALLACASYDVIDIVLGPRWLPTAPLMSVLALAGARETIFYVTPAVMMALGRAALHLRFEMISTAVQVAGIVIGLQFGVLGVAVGYAVAGVLVTPLMLLIQRHLTGLTLRTQFGALWPAVHAGVWASAGYLLVGLLDLPSAATVVFGAIAFAALYASVLQIVHPRTARTALARLRSLRPERSAPRPPVTVSP